MRSISDVTSDRDALRARRETIAKDLQLLDRAAGEAALDAGQQERWENLRRGIERVDADLTRLDDEYREILLRMADDPRHGGRIGQPEPVADDRVDDRSSGVDPRVRTARDAGLRTIERHRDVLSAAAADNLDRLIRQRDPMALGARYLDAVGSPFYSSAFGKMVADPTTGHLRFSPQEVEAVRTVSRIEAERAMSVGTTTAGGFAIPFSLDPSILLSSSGVISPIRQIARSVSIVTDVWKGVSSDGVVAGFAAEATEATDNSPVLAQPVIDTAKAFAFIPFSIEIGMDWLSFESEMARLFADAKATLEATQFLTGTGSNAPGGILNIGGTGGLTTTQRVQTATTNVIAIADVYALKQALPARFVGGASWTANPTNLDRIFRFVGGNSTEPIFYPTRDGNILGIPTYEWSTMTATQATTNRVAIYGDFSQYLIADRIGGTIELVPHLFGSVARLPTGQRGLYYYWRVGSGTLVQTAFKYLEVL